MKLDIYVNYRGTCEEAYRFYERHLGGKMTGMISPRRPAASRPAG